MKTISKERLDELLEYNPETGEFTRKVALNNRTKVGQVAGSRHSEGYVRIKLDGQQHFAHRLAFLAVTGCLPEDLVDHINGNRSDNRWCNLRLATHQQNRMNQAMQATNKSGFTGVHWDQDQKKWRALIGLNNKRLHLGFFDRREDAYEAYLAKRREVFRFQPVPRELLATPS